MSNKKPPADPAAELRRMNIEQREIDAIVRDEGAPKAEPPADLTEYERGRCAGIIEFYDRMLDAQREGKSVPVPIEVAPSVSEPLTDLPPLPESSWHPAPFERAFSGEQMRDYARAALMRETKP